MEPISVTDSSKSPFAPAVLPPNVYCCSSYSDLLNRIYPTITSKDAKLLVNIWDGVIGERTSM